MSNCSIKGCNHTAFWVFKNYRTDDNRVYKICPKHKELIMNPYHWVRE